MFCSGHRYASLFPLGVLQFYHSIAYGYYDARSLNYIHSGTLPLLEWIRLPGDVIFILGGALPLIMLCWQGCRYVLCEKPSAPDEVLFTEVINAGPPRHEVEVVT